MCCLFNKNGSQLFLGCITVPLYKGSYFHSFHCAKVLLNQSTFASKCDLAFVSVGFRNWKKAIQKFSEYAKSQLHIHAMNICAQKGNTVASQLSSAVARQQEEARYGLMKIV